MLNPTITHFVEFERRRLFSRSYAVCGALVSAAERSDCPTCGECLDFLNPGVTAEEMFGATPPGEPVTSTLTNPLKGYREKTRVPTKGTPHVS